METFTHARCKTVQIHQNNSSHSFFFIFTLILDGNWPNNWFSRPSLVREILDPPLNTASANLWVMPVSNFQTLIKSWSIEPEKIPVQFMNLLFSRCLCGWMSKAVGILMDGWCCEFNTQWRQLYFCWFWNAVMSILYKNARNVRFVLLRKNSIVCGNNLMTYTQSSKYWKY